jgi:hypothetical protein
MTDPAFSLSIPGEVPIAICALIAVIVICRTVREIMKDR